jgi:hypothetical protein
VPTNSSIMLSEVRSNFDPYEVPPRIVITCWRLNETTAAVSQ